MGRHKLDKFKHMREANKLFENRRQYQNKTILTEQQLGDATGDGYVDQQDVDHITNNWLQPGDVYDSNDGIINLDDLALTTGNWNQGSPPESLPTGPCWLSSVVAAGGTPGYNPGGSYGDSYCFHWFNVGAGPGIGNFPLVPNPWEWNPNNPYTNFNQPPFSTPGQPTGTGASNFIDCGCDLSGNTAPNWFTGTTTGSTTGTTTGSTANTCYAVSSIEKCDGSYFGNYAFGCAKLDGQYITPSNVGSIGKLQLGATGWSDPGIITGVNQITPGQWEFHFTSATCPTTGTTTGSTTTCYGCNSSTNSNGIGGGVFSETFPSPLPGCQQINIPGVGNLGCHCGQNNPFPNNPSATVDYFENQTEINTLCDGTGSGTTSGSTGGTSLKCYGCMSGVIVDSWMYPNASQFVTSDSSGICSVYANNPGQNPWAGEPNVWYTDVNSVTPGGASGDPCGGANTGNTCDISYNTPCASQHLTTGQQNSWDPWLGLRQTGWDSVGCQHLQNVVNWTTNQLNSGVTGNGTPLNPTQIARKTEKREWAQCQAAECGCATLNVPALTGGPTPPPPSAPPQSGGGGGGPDSMAMKKPKIDKKEKEKEKEKKEVMKEEFTRMKTLWKYRI